MVRQSAANAEMGTSLALKATAFAEESSESVGQVVQTMRDIGSASRKIEDITAVIDGISFQTNILALNAAVEAARAGDQGRGYAVVAAEVRTLAQRSAAAAKQIKSIISDSVSKVAAGNVCADAAGQKMGSLLAAVGQVGALIDELSGSATCQRRRIEEVSASVSEIDRVTQQNAALVEQGAAAANLMQDQMKSLARTVSVFRVEAAQARA
jgi:methyl-accepting chemotaxis protein